MQQSSTTMISELITTQINTTGSHWLSSDSQIWKKPHLLLRLIRMASTGSVRTMSRINLYNFRSHTRIVSSQLLVRNLALLRL